MFLSEDVHVTWQLINAINHVLPQVLAYNHHVIDFIHSHIMPASMVKCHIVRVIQASVAVLSILHRPYQVVVHFGSINHRTHIVVPCHRRHAQNETFHPDCHRKSNDLNLSHLHSSSKLKSKEISSTCRLLISIIIVQALMSSRRCERVMRIRSQMVK